MGSRYSIVVNVALFASVLPVIAAWQLVDTLDGYPYLVSAAVGLVLVALLRGATRPLRARMRRRSAALVAGEVAPAHAPGGFVVWLAPPLWCIALALFLNAWLDRSPPQLHASQVLRHTTPQKGPGRVVLRGWRSGEAELELSSNSRFGGLRDGAAVTVVVRGGLFGWERIESITPQ